MVFFLLLPAGIALLLFGAMHGFLWRRLGAQKGLGMIIKTAGISYGIALIAAPLLDIGMEHLWVSLPVFLFFLLLYLHVYVAIFRSLSIRILEELSVAGDQGLSRLQLDEVYPLRTMFTSRLDILEHHGWIILQNGAYICTSKGRTGARMISAARRLYGVKNAG